METGSTNNVKDDSDISWKLLLVVFVAGMLAGAILWGVVAPLIWWLIRLVVVAGAVIIVGYVVFKLLNRSSRS